MSREIVIGFFATLLMLVTAILFNHVDEQASILEISSIVGVSFVLFIACVATYHWYQVKIVSFKDFITKIEHSVDRLLDKQRFIDQEILNIIEREADIIWVITTKLGTELGDKEMEQSVENNLKNSKEYIYFLPHQDNHHYSSIIERNLSRFKDLDLFKKYGSQISFIRLPAETHFLLEEVVIYNPLKDEDEGSETKGLNGFTYYEASDDSDEQLLRGKMKSRKYHMKIEGDMLAFLRDRLLAYLKSVGLHNSVQRILSDYSASLNQVQLQYLAGIINEKKITDQKAHEIFLDSLSENPQSKGVSKSIRTILSRHVEVT
ncbi:MAG: hypothetical protein LGR52_16220 [Candidatus Thiosymbion ectosymbiont of Robbea hypermnestra]|nr:hypothetical protein [Candidatus Thiosymbion ectosymbiont of Robbea hypermnestra]